MKVKYLMKKTSSQITADKNDNVEVRLIYRDVIIDRYILKLQI